LHIIADILQNKEGIAHCSSPISQ